MEKDKPKSLAEMIAQGVYGKSGDPDAPENQNPDFQSGYKIGMNSESTSMDLIHQEWIRIGSPVVPPKSFEEWKRGMWAAVMKKITEKEGK